MKKYILIVAALFLSSCSATQNEQISFDEDSPQVDRVIPISAKRFEFTPNVIRIKKGETVRFEVDNTDTLHDFLIPELNLSSENILNAKQVGEYEFVCANFCGEGHATMKGTIIIEE